MAAVSLIDFANHHRQPPAPGIEILETPYYQIVLQPDLPIPGPNSVSFIRCGDAEPDDVIAQVRAIVAPRRLPLMWTLDPETDPADFARHLERNGVHPEPHAPKVDVMVLPIDAEMARVAVPGLEFHDALADLETFRQWDAVNALAFGSRTLDDDPGFVASQERRRLNQRAAGNRRLVLATIDGEPAGSSGLTLFPPEGAIINGGAVLPEFRGNGIYRSMVHRRLEMAREAGVPGLAVWGAHTSAPILARLGFETVGWRLFYRER